MADMNSPRPQEQGREELKGAANEARRAAEGAAQTAQTRVTEAAQTARARAEAEAERRKNQVGDEAGRLAEAFRAGEEKLSGGWEAQAFGYAAEAADELAHSIRDRSPGEMMGALSDFGRRNPGLFLGAATLAGFALARIATATSDTRPNRPNAGYAGGPYGTYNPAGSRHTPGVHTPPLTPSRPAPGPSPTYGAAPTPVPSPAPGVVAPTPSAAPASDPLSPTARPVGVPGETKKEY